MSHRNKRRSRRARGRQRTRRGVRTRTEAQTQCLGRGMPHPLRLLGAPPRPAPQLLPSLPLRRFPLRESHCTRKEPAKKSQDCTNKARRRTPHEHVREYMCMPALAAPTAHTYVRTYAHASLCAYERAYVCLRMPAGKSLVNLPRRTVSPRARARVRSRTTPCTNVSVHSCGRGWECSHIVKRLSSPDPPLTRKDRGGASEPADSDRESFARGAHQRRHPRKYFCVCACACHRVSTHGRVYVRTHTGTYMQISRCPRARLQSRT
jgi:hypothetical protein